MIEDSPLSMSSAERRRRDRQSLELQTESRIVEKLEEARMEDERRRSERLFNQSFGSGDHSQPAPQQVQVIQAPVAAPVVPVEAVKPEPKVNVKEEVRAALEEMKPKEEAKPTEYYIQGLVGMGNYPDAVNVRGNVSTGFSVGIVTPERIVAEGTFQYSEFDIETMNPGYSYATPPFKTLSQYNFSAAMKYQLFSGRVRPVVGAVAGYTYRSYRDQQTYYYSTNAGNVSTNAFDVGGLVGLDVQLTNSFSIGVDLRYMKNIAYRENSDYQRSFVYQRVGKAVEELDYYMSSLVARFMF
ncbi:MAG: outer membrane beta-barrel protein [Bdellovibrionales bacterium]|nr:outer membrane beta-barrel protein [Bdellovibrionales bacterium]